MTNTNCLLKRTLRKEKVERPPVWFMRQAGRILPSYLALKEKYTFKQMMEDPKLGAEVTLLPVNDLGVDAAILFSDILVIPQALGMDLHFPDSGPVFSNPLAEAKNPSSILKADASKLNYIYDVIDEINRTKSLDTPLIGFCGSPFTVLLYMLQGLHGKSEFPDAIKYIYANKKKTSIILEQITELSIEYMSQQIAHGIDMFQLFDTHAGLIPFNLYRELILPQVQKMATVAKEKAMPFVFFPKGIGTGLAELTPNHGDFVSIDWQTDLQTARSLVNPEIGLQGNLDPRILWASEDELLKTLERYKEFGANNNDWIFNLGHGFLPSLPVEKAKFIVDWVKTTDWQRC